MRLSLRWKLLASFGLLLAVMGLLAWLTWSLFVSLRGVQEEVLDEAVPGLIAADEVVLAYQGQFASVRGNLLARAEDVVAAYESRKRQVRGAETRALSLFSRGPEREALQDLSAAGRAFERVVEGTVFPLLQAGERREAAGVLQSQGRALIEEVESQGERIRQAALGRAERAEAELRRRSQQSRAILTGVVTGGFLLAIAIAFVTTRRLSANLSRLLEAARAVGRGSLEQRVEVTSRDEVGELAERFMEMQDGLRRLQQLALQERELEIAAQIQRNLQRELPSHSGVHLSSLQRQAGRVGGDFYDVDLAGNLLIVVVGDASGKGIGAALAATVALSFLRAERARGPEPRRVVERTNRALLEVSEESQFLTLLYAALDLSAGKLSWINMGHPTPFLIKASGEGYFVEGPRNRVLGWFEEPGLQETVLTLEPGDRLVFYTDGFVEARSEQGEFFGEARLGELLTELARSHPDCLEEEAVARVEQFTAGKLEDDLTMLSVVFEGAAGAGRKHETGAQSWLSKG